VNEDDRLTVLAPGFEEVGFERLPPLLAAL
jgi:hypothetical protein